MINNLSLVNKLLKKSLHVIRIVICDNLIFLKIKTENKYNKGNIRINKYKDFKFKVLNNIYYLFNN